MPSASLAIGFVEAAARGDGAGWDELFDRHYPVVFRYALARLGERSAAEEVAQEVFVAAVTGVGRLRDHSETGVRAWLLGIARFKCVDQARRRARLGRLVVDPPVADDPGEVAVSRLHAAELRRAMEVLTEDQRDVVIRRFVLDQSLEEVATATRRPLGAVKSMQHRALASLERALRRGGRS